MSQLIDEKVIQARQAGYSWEDINRFLGSKIDAAKARGYSDDDINNYLGLAPASTERSIKQGIIANQNVVDTGETAKAPSGPPPTVWDAFNNGLRQSSGGLVANQSSDPAAAQAVVAADQNYATHLAAMAGGLVGDLPAGFVGALAGAIGTSETVVGAPVGAMAGGFALPQYLRSLYADGLLDGSVKDSRDFAMRYSKVLWETAKAGTVGASTAIMGAGAGAKVAELGGGKVLQSLTQTGAELGTMVTVSKQLEGQLPSYRDWADGALMLFAMKGVAASPKAVLQAKSALIEYWKQTGEPPIEAAKRANEDEGFRAQLLGFVKDESGSVPPPPKPAKPVPTSQGKPVLTNPLPSATAWDRVAAHQAEPSAPKSAWDSVTDAATIYRESFNQKSPMINLVEKAEETSGRSLRDMEDPRQLYRMVENSGAVARYVIEQEMVTPEGKPTGTPGLMKIIEPFAKEDGNENFWTYAVAKWAVEKADQVKETGVHIDDAREVVKSGKGKYEKAFNQLVDWQNGTLDHLKDIMSQEAIDQIKAENKARIPGYREGKESRNAGKSSAFNPVKEMLGSDLQIKNVMQSLLHEAFVRTQVGSVVRLRKQLAQVGIDSGQAKMAKTRTVHATLTPEELYNLQSDLLKDPDYLSGNVEATIFRNLGHSEDKNSIGYFEDGKYKAVEFDDPHLTEFLKGADRGTQGWFSRMMAGYTRFVRGSIVMAPTFGIRVLGYDLPFQFGVSPEFRNVLGNFYSGIKGLVTKDADLAAWHRSGGYQKVFGELATDKYFQELMKGESDPAFLERTWNLINPITNAKRLGRMLTWWGSVLHDAQQLGQFKSAKKAGKSDTRAGFEASEASFPPQGAGGSRTKALNAQIPFFTAYLNGLEVTLRAQLGMGLSKFTGKANKNFLGEAFNATQFSARMAAIVTVPMLMQTYLYKDEPWYKKQSNTLKDNGLFFHVGSSTGGYTFYYKYPPIISFLYGTIPHRIMKSMLEENPDMLLHDVGTSAAFSFAPPGFLYSFWQPFIEHMANFSFHSGEQIVPDGVKDNALPSEQFSPWSTELAKRLSQAFTGVPILGKLSAPIIDNYISNWAGTLGGQALGTLENALQASGVIKQGRPAVEWTNLPGFSSFIKRVQGASSQPLRDYREKVDYYAQVHGSMTRAMANNDVARFQELAFENPTFVLLNQFRPTGVNKIIIGGSPNAGRYQAILEAAAAHGNPALAQAIDNTDKTVDLLGKLATLLNQVETPAIREAIESVQKTGVQGELSPTDKQQLLDRIYIRLQQVAERGNQLIRATEQ